MEGWTAELISSDLKYHRDTVRDVFGPNFQDIGSWRSFLRSKLNDNVSAMLKAPPARWNIGSFHALFVACWIHHPVEKGTFMLNLMGESVAQREVIRAAFKKHLSSRPSSHLSGKGRSASKGWRFLNGYDELLVQFEETKGKPYLMLKAEGHTTGPSGVIPHLQSWVHKKRHGEGLMASPALNKLANTSPLVSRRAAENYGKSYKDLLKKVLGFHGKQVTARDMIGVLFEKTRYNKYPSTLAMTASNRELGEAIEAFCADASRSRQYTLAGKIEPGMLAELGDLASTLKRDGDIHRARVFEEVRVDPQEVDRSLAFFYNYA